MGFSAWVKWTISLCTLLMLAGPLSAVAKESLPQERVEAFIEEEMEQAGIPGLSLVIVKGKETLFKQSFGLADERHSVTSETLFELGSTSKAFTGLAVLQSERAGRLKLGDPVSKYLPWFQMKFEGQVFDITIEQLLHHTSGLPEKAIGYLPSSSDQRALEETVQAVMPLGLVHQPGTRFEYSTINYDVLGLILESVTGQSFAEVAKQEVLEPLGLAHTFAGREQAPPTGLATGFKRQFFQSVPFFAPDYRGNTPAGYFITNINDMERWLRIQLETVPLPVSLQELIRRSHEPDRQVAPSANGSSYAAGWEVYQVGAGELSHEGSNPNFTSFVGFRPSEQIGVAVLANLGSDYTAHIGNGILNLMQHKEIRPLQFDKYKKTDQIASVLCLALGLTAVGMIGYLGRFVWQIKGGARFWQAPGRKAVYQLISTLLLLGISFYALYRLPDLLFDGMPWTFLQVWAPATVALATKLAVLTGALYGFYSLFNILFPKPNDKSFLTLVVLGVLSGFGNAFLIFVINETFVRTHNLDNGLLLYFILGILMYVVSQRYMRTRIVIYANRLVYEKRMALIDRLLGTPFRKFEDMERGRIEATLNNDTEVISHSLNLLVTAGTSLITLVFCFLYLGVMNIYAFLMALAIIVLAVGLYSLIGRQADKVWNETRDIQNMFFRLLQDLIHGFKELRLHDGKRSDFRKTLDASCDEYRAKRTLGDIKFANVFVVGELLFVLVIGVVSFLFPEIFKNIPKETIHNYVLVFLYMTGPVNELLNGIPQFVHVRISWQRIQEMIRNIEHLDSPLQETHKPVPTQQPFSLELRNVMYRYKSQSLDAGSFGVGPISYLFASGEIIFITGGNGSGKSTLSKLITGLYTPDSGEILLNGQLVSLETLQRHYSAILSDFHLFDRLYGISTEGREAEIEQYLKLLQLFGKVGVTDGRFTTTELSAGQKKRLALLVTYLEDRPFLLFDEWAADQDPAYRRFFYQELLPQLRAQGKCVIAITHDDHYFQLADKLIAMDTGRIRELQVEEVLA